MSIRVEYTIDGDEGFIELSERWTLKEIREFVGKFIGVGDGADEQANDEAMQWLIANKMVGCRLHDVTHTTTVDSPAELTTQWLEEQADSRVVTWFVQAIFKAIHTMRELDPTNVRVSSD